MRFLQRNLHGAQNDTEPLSFMSNRSSCAVSQPKRPPVAPLESHACILQRRADHVTTSPSAPSIVHDVLRSPGRPLDSSTRAFMEPRFGRDFSGIKIHTDRKAAQSAMAVNASAYAVGRDLVFGENQYAPHTRAGRQLLAHELTHALQQNGRDGSSIAPGALSIGRPDSRAELDANRTAAAIETNDDSLSPFRFGSSDLALARNLAPNVSGEVDDTIKETLVTGKKGKTTDYKWHAKYSVYLYDNDLVIEVRIKLKGKVSEKTKRKWLDGINAKWNNKYRLVNDKKKISISFRAVFTDVNPQQEVNVVKRPKTSGDWNMGTWDAGDGEGDTQGNAAAHEFGHMIGNKDENDLPDGKGGKKTLDGVMGDAAKEAKERHFEQFRTWLNAHRTPKESEFRLEKVK